MPQTIRHMVSGRIGIALLVFAAFLLAGVATLNDYGVTLDEVPNFLVGERHARFWLELHPERLTFRDERPLDPDELGRGMYAWYTKTADAMRPGQHHGFADLDFPFPWAYPPLANTLSGASCIVFFHWLGWLPPIEAHHLAIVVFAALGGALVYAWTARRFGAAAGLLGAFFLCAYPRFFADAHNNVKDLPETVLFAAAMFALVSATERRTVARLAVFGIVWGLALAIKPNAAFLPLAASPWVLLAWRESRPSTRAIAALLATPVLALGTVALLWPYLWVGHPIDHVSSFLEYYRLLGTFGPPRFQWLPAVYAVAVTPLPLILWAIVGASSLVRRRDPMAVLLLAWLVVPILRVSVPRAYSYDGIRHYMEFLPALGILGGIGLARAARSVASASRGGRTAAVALVLTAIVPIAWANVRLHPYQTVYFGGAVGGFRGAVRLALPSAFDYWGTSLREGVEWLGEHAEPHATVVVPFAVHVARYDVPRGDLRIAHRRWLPPDFDGWVLRLVRNDRHGWKPVLKQLRRYRPVHVISADGVPLLEIYRVRRAD
ncbi:MAG: hypothetical protein QOD06_3393 [Candidatus Binatota bacterium]|nr:hypothetical protein [Candidatus Binatota bacterium]